MHQLLLLLLAAVSSVSALTDPKKKAAKKAMEGCKLVWEEEENCVTESNVEICRMKDTQHCEEVKDTLFHTKMYQSIDQKSTVSWLDLFKVSKIVCQPMVSQEQYRSPLQYAPATVLSYFFIDSGQAKEGGSGGRT